MPSIQCGDIFWDAIKDFIAVYPDMISEKISVADGLQKTQVGKNMTPILGTGKNIRDEMGCGSQPSVIGFKKSTRLKAIVENRA
jgi:hypothetical protein